MKVTFEKTETTQEVVFEGTVKDLLVKLKVNPETILVACNGEIVQEDHVLKNSDDVLILNVVSGG